MTKLKVRLLCDLHAGDLFIIPDCSKIRVYMKVRIPDGNFYQAVELESGTIKTFPLYTKVVKVSGNTKITGIDTEEVPEKKEITIEDILKYFSI